MPERRGLSTKNATELPKCSKTLHFRLIGDPAAFYIDREQKTNKTPENEGIEGCFGGWIRGFVVTQGCLTPLSPGIGPQGAAVGG
jgi:hypothetical protein